MGLSSIFKRPDPVPPSPATGDAGDPVQHARTRARRRLIGAAVLLMTGVIVFPLVFETRPRPIAIDVPIEIPKREGAPALSMPTLRPVAPTGEPAAESASAATPIITETQADQGRELPPRPEAPGRAESSDGSTGRPVRPAAAPVVEPARPAPRSAAVAPGATADAARKPAAPTAAAVAAGDGSRAKALLEGRPAAASAAAPAAMSGEASRFVVQVGAFAEGDAAREARAKAEKLGLKTYTQVAQTPAGSRIRVRMGPFGTRAEADAALAKARAAGLTAVVLTL